jgi:hypothetical protein
MLREISTTQLLELKDILDQLETADYSRPMGILENSSIGKHVRHILEFYECLFITRRDDTVCYDDRKRNILLEENARYAGDYIIEIIDHVEKADINKRLVLKAKYGKADVLMESSLFREMTYNIEHTVHHLAIIRIAANTELGYIRLSGNFGYAHSTLKYIESKNTSAK